MKMSDNNSNRKTSAQQTSASHYEQARAHLKGGFHNSAVKASELAKNPPQGKAAAAIYAAKTASAGGKEYGKSAYHAGMGFMEGVSKQNPNSGQQLNNMKINQSIKQGRSQAMQSNQNKGIESARQKTAVGKTTQSGKSNNQGIRNLQNKTSGQSAGNSKSSGAGSGQSGGSSKGR